VSLFGNITKAVRRETGRWLFDKVSGDKALSLSQGERVSSTARLYMEMTAVLRDQLSAQLETASSNDLISVASVAAGLALVVGLVIVKATLGCVGYWWWYPLPALIAPLFILSFPLLPRKNRLFHHGPHIPTFLVYLADHPQPLEDVLVTMIQRLQEDWEGNDALLKTEAACIRWGLITLSVASFVGLGLYTWGLS
jgi:hypothetical protein